MYYSQIVHSNSSSSNNTLLVVIKQKKMLATVLTLFLLFLHRIFCYNMARQA